MRCPECGSFMERTDDGRLWVCRSDGAAVDDVKVISRRERNLEHVRRCRAVLERAERKADAKREAGPPEDLRHLTRVA